MNVHARLFPAGIAVVATCLMSPSIAAPAQTVRSAVADFGLLGSWADDCDQPASTSSRSIFTVAADGTVLRRVRTGGRINPKLDYKLLSARRIAADQLAIEVQSSSEKLDIILEKSDQGVRARQVVQQGKVTIANGADVQTGRPLSYMKKCP